MDATMRRAAFELPPSPFGQVDASIGKNTAKGVPGILAPTREIA